MKSAGEVVVELVSDGSAAEDTADDEATPSAHTPTLPLQRVHDLVLRMSHPFLMLCFMSFCNFLNYVDRGAIAGSMPAIDEDFHLSDTREGLVAAAFMLGYMVTAPFFGHMSRKVRPATLMCIGLCVWSLAAIGTGLSVGYYSLLIVRTVIGVGEASFVGLAPTYIDDVSPAKWRSVWLGVFFSMIPIGAAVGYVVAGLFSATGYWELSFFFEAALMLPIAALCYFLPDPRSVVLEVGWSAKKEPPSSEGVSFFSSIYLLVSNLRYDLVVLGYAAVCFVTGALYFWAPTYVVKELGVDIFDANLGIGVITVICGLVGTFIGGLLVDRLGGGEVVATALVVFFSVVVFPLVLTTFIVNSVLLFFVLVTVGELMLFAVTAPINILCLSVVEQQNRSFGISLQIFMIHLLGDFPSPFIVGAISDMTNIRVAMIFSSMWMLYAIFFFSMALIAVRVHQKRMVYEGASVMSESTLELRLDQQINNSNTVPLSESDLFTLSDDDEEQGGSVDVF